MASTHSSPPWADNTEPNGNLEGGSPEQINKRPSEKLFRSTFRLSDWHWNLITAIICAIISPIVLSILDDGRDPTLDSPMGITDSPFTTPYPCHFLGAFEQDASEFENAKIEKFYDSRPTPFGVGQVNFVATAEGESSYTVTDTRLVDVEPIDDRNIETYADATMSACGSAGDTAVVAEYDFSDPGSRQFQNMTNMTDVRTTDHFPPSSVTSSSSLTIRANVNSCENSYRFNIAIDYTKSGSTDIHTEEFGPYVIYSPNHSKPLVVANQTEGTLVPGEWGKDDKVCTDEFAD